MSDRKSWDERHRDSEFLGESSPFLEECLPDLPVGLALDAPCGLGRNALRLGEAGYSVDALDWSFQATRKLRTAARSRRLAIRPLVCDLVTYPFPRARYDLVVSVRFLERSLWPALTLALKPGGALLVETFNTRHLGRKPDFPRELCLEVGELLATFESTLRVARYRETASESTACLLAFRESREGRRAAAEGS